jgi:acetyl esterase
MPPDKRRALRDAKAPRLLTDHLNGRIAAGVRTTDHSVPTASGPLQVRVYRPTDPEGRELPVVVAFHGGGWMFGNLDTAQWLWSEVAAQVPAVVVAGTYRLAPEHPAPAALEDAFAITAWAVEHARELGGDPARVAVMGESSGGTLAASVALRARDTGEFSLRCQALVYPITDLTLSSPSITSMPDEPILSSADLTAYVQAYLGPNGSPTDPYVSPLLAEDHRGLPAAVVVSADHDPLRDDAVRYAEQLRDCGVPVESIELDDSPHGVFSFPNLCRASGPALELLVTALRRALGVEAP